MKPILSAGIMLGVAAGIWMFINGFAGLYKNPGTAWVFPVVATVIEIAVIVWGLRKTAELGRRYGGQVLAGLLIAVVGAVLIMGFSMIWSQVFTDAPEIIAAMQADKWADAGMSEEKIDERLVNAEFTRGAVFSAVSGGIMTIVTGLVISLIAAIFVRQKDA
jgi:hypothetical protein